MRLESRPSQVAAGNGIGMAIHGTGLAHPARRFAGSSHEARLVPCACSAPGAKTAHQSCALSWHAFRLASPATHGSHSAHSSHSARGSHHARGSHGAHGSHSARGSHAATQPINHAAEMHQPSPSLETGAPSPRLASIRHMRGSARQTCCTAPQTRCTSTLTALCSVLFADHSTTLATMDPYELAFKNLYCDKHVSAHLLIEMYGCGFDGGEVSHYLKEHGETLRVLDPQTHALLVDVESDLEIDREIEFQLDAEAFFLETARAEAPEHMEAELLAWAESIMAVYGAVVPLPADPTLDFAPLFRREIAEGKKSYNGCLIVNKLSMAELRSELYFRGADWSSVAIATKSVLCTSLCRALTTEANAVKVKEHIASVARNACDAVVRRAMQTRHVKAASLLQACVRGFHTRRIVSRAKKVVSSTQAASGSVFLAIRTRGGADEADDRPAFMEPHPRGLARLGLLPGSSQQPLLCDTSAAFTRAAERRESVITHAPASQSSTPVADMPHREGTSPSSLQAGGPSAVLPEEEDEGPPTGGRSAVPRRIAALHATPPVLQPPDAGARLAAVNAAVSATAESFPFGRQASTESGERAANDPGDSEEISDVDQSVLSRHLAILNYTYDQYERAYKAAQAVQESMDDEDPEQQKPLSEEERQRLAGLSNAVYARGQDIMQARQELTDAVYDDPGLRECQDSTRQAIAELFRWSDAMSPEAERRCLAALPPSNPPSFCSKGADVCLNTEDLEPIFQALHEQVCGITPR